MIAKVILCVNAGSSSLKFALYQIGDGKEIALAQGAVERSGRDAHLWINSAQQRIEKAFRNLISPLEALHQATSELDRLTLPHPDGVGHRIVHGGPNHITPARISDVLVQELRDLIPFAPLHLPEEIAGIEAVNSRFPNTPQVACFDTAFHRSMPEVAERFSLPRTLWEEGIRRYGFHGISYEYIMQVLGRDLPAQVIIAHLGNGASMAAIKDGRPLDTTMGFTPTGGFMMGTRSGDLDPGVLLYLLQQKHLDAEHLERLVNDEAGLLGVSSITSDLKTLLERRAVDHGAAMAVDMFCYQLRKHIGALSAVLGGLDLLVFTGGIGERAAAVRWEVCRGLEYLGITLDPGRNDATADTISADDSPCRVRAIPTNEDLMIARHTYKLIFSSQNESAHA
jgi:acetate kinase